MRNKFLKIQKTKGWPKKCRPAQGRSETSYNKNRSRERGPIIRKKVYELYTKPESSVL